jgi:hypothetical protein
MCPLPVCGAHYGGDPEFFFFFFFFFFLLSFKTLTYQLQLLKKLYADGS